MKRMGLAGVALASMVLCTLIIYPLKHVAPAVSLSVVYRPAVLVVSITWGAWLGVATAAVSAGPFNFFHLPPAGQFTIRDSSNGVVLVAFLLVAATAGSVAEVTRARTRDAQECRP
jgi:two-component system sensor histidine kinase KdpD